MQPLNPVQIEQHILDLSNQISKGVSVHSQRLAEAREKEREFLRAFHQARLRAEGTVADRESFAILHSMDEREARDVAEIAYRHADKIHKALDSELRAWQSIGASVRQQYAVAGRGEGA